MSKSQVAEWLNTLPEDADIAIDEGGLTLVVVGEDAYLEVGGEPEEEDEDEGYPREDVCRECGAHVGWIMSPVGHVVALGICDNCAHKEDK